MESSGFLPARGSDASGQICLKWIPQIETSGVPTLTYFILHIHTTKY
jgi:hypothetical protein